MLQTTHEHLVNSFKLTFVMERVDNASLKPTVLGFDGLCSLFNFTLFNSDHYAMLSYNNKRTEEKKRSQCATLVAIFQRRQM